MKTERVTERVNFVPRKLILTIDSVEELSYLEEIYANLCHAHYAEWVSSSSAHFLEKMLDSIRDKVKD